jgi:hypothetical protein
MTTLREQVSWLNERIRRLQMRHAKYREQAVKRRIALKAENAYLKAILREKDKQP